MTDRRPSSKRLRRALGRAFPDRPFELRFWDGQILASTTGPAPSLTIASPRAIGHLLRSPDQLGLGRAYVSGDIEVEDLDGVIALEGRWDPPRIGAATRARIAAAGLAVHGAKRLPDPPGVELRLVRERHTPARDAAAVRHHYDVSNDFFALFLDPTMTYSCALWRDQTTLEEAQRAKLELICSKLDLSEGSRLLDIGCGWASLAIRAAQTRGARVLGITLSPAQAELARERVERAGVGDRVDIRVLDYRDLGGEQFDAVASIGMVEHVGEARIDTYARCVAEALAPGGRFLNHGITWAPAEPYQPNELSDRYVFPDGEVLPLSRMLRAFERAGFQLSHVEELDGDYAITLSHWARRLDERIDEAIALAGQERTRVWRLYLRAARKGFEIGDTTVHQILCRRRGK